MNFDDNKTENVEDIEQQFISLFIKYFKYDHKMDKFESDGMKIMIEQIRYWIDRNEPIHCCLPSFPAKSPTTQKVFSPYPDYGEYLALKQLYQFASDVTIFYEYGCKILIIADGRVYGDLIGIDRENIILYKQEILKMIKNNGFDKYLLYTNLTMELEYDGDDLIHIFLEKYGNNMDIKQMEENIKKDKNLQTVCYGMAKFLEYDNSPWNKDEFKSNRAIKKFCQNRSKNMMIRSNAYSNLIKTHYPNHIRFSIHGHDNNCKFAVALFKQFGINYCITPWHNVTCKMLDHRILLITKTIVDKINEINEKRLSLDIDSRVSIYSRKDKIWYDDGIIDEIQCIESSEWLAISYDKDKKAKRIQRFSNCLRPIIKNNDDQNMHSIDIKHLKEYTKEAFDFDKWSIGSTKAFKIVYKENRKWCYSEV